jgi:transposase
MDSNIISLLRVPGFRVCDVQLLGEEITIAVRKRSKTARCPCGKRSKKIHDYLKEQRILHMTLSLQKVYLKLQKRRFVCSCCGKTFTETISFLPKRSRMSIYVQQEALEKLSDTSFQKTTKRTGISYGSLVSLLNKVFSFNSIDWDMHIVEGKLRIGIDEHHFGKKHKYLTTIANLLTGKPIHILTKTTKAAVKEFLLSLPESVKEKVDEVVSDMRDSFIQAAKEALPNTRIVIDHFHIIQDANRRVQEARKIEEDVQEKIKGNGVKSIPWKLLTRNKEDLKGEQDTLVSFYLNRFPILAHFYSCKEKLREMYRFGTKEEAQIFLDSLIYEMKHTDNPELWQWAITLIKYQPYILNYFDNHSTNAVTEGLHRKFKLIQRTAFGFRNPEVYVRRIMLACLPLSFFLAKLPH